MSKPMIELITIQNNLFGSEILADYIFNWC